MLVLLLHVYAQLTNPFGFLAEVVLLAEKILLFILIPIKFIFIIFTIYKTKSLPRLPYKLTATVIYVTLTCIFIFIVLKQQQALHQQSLSGDCIDQTKYSVDFLNEKKEQMIQSLIEHDKEMRKASILQKGGNESDANLYVASFEEKYLHEKEKFFLYCKNASSQCEINTTAIYPDGFWKKYSMPTEVKTTIKYIYDDESKKFFNDIKYVGNIDTGNQIIWNNEDVPIFLENKSISQLNRWDMVGSTFSATGPYICDCGYVRCDYLQSQWFIWRKTDDITSPNKIIKIKQFAVQIQK